VNTRIGARVEMRYDNMARNIKLGIVKWFGTDDIDYGFIEQIDSDNDIYFKIYGIDKESAFLDKDRKNELVVYSYAENERGPIAKRVRLFCEASVQERRLLCELYSESEKVKLRLMENAPEFYAGRDIDFYLPFLQISSMREEFIQVCSSIPLEALQQKLKSEIGNEIVKEVIISNLPEVIMSNNMKDYFSDISIAKVKELFISRYSNGYFDKKLSTELAFWIRAEVDYVKSKTYMDFLYREFAEIVDWGKESNEDLIMLIKAIKTVTNSKLVAHILAVKPDILKNEEISLISNLSVSDLRELEWNDVFKDKEDSAIICRLYSTNKQIIIVAANNCPIEILLETREIHEYVSEKRMCEIIDTIDWNKTESDYIALYKCFLESIEADKFEKAALDIAIKLRNSGRSFNVTWWGCLADSVKVRVLIHNSNFAEEKGNWFEDLKTINVMENGNPIISALLYYFVNIYQDNKPKMNEKFRKAHGLLMNYIVDSFNSGIKVSHALNTLLDKCQWDYGYNSGISFCDGRSWPAEGVVFCPEGKSRPDYGRKKCKFFKDDNLTNTKYKESKDYKDQFLNDLLLNVGYMPDLSDIGIKEKDLKEYPFRIAGYVNRLLKVCEHLKCSKCGNHFTPKFEYAKMKNARIPINRFTCNVSDDNEHDTDVYVNFCYHCDRVIDSRECKIRVYGNYGQYLCRYCGGADEVSPGTVCPNCGNSDKNRLNYNSGKLISCEACNYDARNYVKG